MSQPETPQEPATQTLGPQALEADLGQLVAHRTRHGTMIAPPKDMYVGRALEVYGEYNKAEADALLQMIKSGMTVVEVGANIGSHSVALAKACAPGPLYVFEPQQRLFQMLCANLVLNGVRNAIVSPDAVGEAEGVASIPQMNYGGKGNFGGVSLQATKAADGPYTTRVRPLDSCGLKRCHLIKVDVEGWEVEVLKGAAQTIAAFRPVLYVENDRPERQQELIKLIDSMGYDQYWHVPLLFHPDNFNGVSEDLWPGVASLNMLCIPKERGATVKGLAKIDPDNFRSPLKVPERR